MGHGDGYMCIGLEERRKNIERVKEVNHFLKKSLKRQRTDSHRLKG